MSDSVFLSNKLIKSSRHRLSIFDRRLIIFIIVLLVFNILDVLFTLWGLQLEVIEESNPLMQQLIINNPIAVMTIKIVLPIFLGAALWHIRNTSRKLVSYGLGVVLTCYSCVMIMHGYWIIHMIE